ncbi:unnamed protein product [Cladocopium goreaui]|uniref:WD_REPEATS_REGION domain-containing protein n=1 Tax=Cladocopium goreaui TaxID=2562237 RepID=A0A9P1DCN3_9DINO|nr:unnamed protein product [Cladocopium goreaui]
MSPKEEKRKNQIVLDSDEEGAVPRRPKGGGATTATMATAATTASPPEDLPEPQSESLLENQEDRLNLERAASAFLRNRGYVIEDAHSDVALKVQHRCRAFHKVAQWASSTVPPVLDELLSALGPLASVVSTELTRVEGEGSAKRFNARYQDLLRRDRRRAKSDSSEGKREVFMSQLSHHLLLSYLGRPDMTSLLDIFFDTVRVKHEQQPTSSALFCETALTVSADDKSKKRKTTSSKTVPLPSKPTAVQDELHRPASIVSLLLDTAPEVPVHVGSISDDQRFCAAGCDRDVRIFHADSRWGPSLDSTVGLKGQRLGCHGGRVLSTAFSPNSELLLSGGQDGCIQLWNTRSSTLALSYRQADPVWCVDWAPLGHYFVTSGKDGEALLWSAARSGEPLRVYGAAGPEVQALRVQTDGRRVVTAHCDSFIFWDLASALPTRILREATTPRKAAAAVTCLAFSRDGHMLAAGHADGRLTLLDLRALRTGEKGASSTHAAHRGAVQALCWSKAKTKQNNDVLFSSSGSHLLMRELSGFRQVQKTDVKLAMDHVLCCHATVGHTLVLGTSL